MPSITPLAGAAIGGSAVFIAPFAEAILNTVGYALILWGLMIMAVRLWKSNRRTSAHR